jgi:hypothetical protein
MRAGLVGASFRGRATRPAVPFGVDVLSAQRGRFALPRTLWKTALGILCAVAFLTLAQAADSTAVAALIAKGQAAHDNRCLNDASGFYRDALTLDPPVALSEEQTALIMKFAPRLHTVPGEFFPLKDIVAVVHPDRPIIGYHLFWDDDIDFPADNEPADHEIIWVEYDPVNQAVIQISAYLHGYIAHGEGAPAEANAHGGRPWIGVEWGKHGSLPWGSPDGAEGAGKVLHHNWTMLYTKGRQKQDHPLARGWPVKFTGELAAYKDFSVALDPRPLLEERRLMIVSRWPNAVINQHCLRYNFAPKTEWPWLQQVRR